MTEILKDEEIVILLQLVHKTIFPYYQFYADLDSLLNFKGFIGFCKDFGIFPDYMTKAKLYKFFSTLAGFYME